MYSLLSALVAAIILNSQHWLVLSITIFPFTIMPLYTTMLRLDKSQIEASQDLGAGPVRTFRKIILPMTMAWRGFRGNNGFYADHDQVMLSLTFLAKVKWHYLVKYIEIYFTQNQWHDGSFLALVMLVLILASVLVSANFAKKSKKGEANVW